MWKTSPSVPITVQRPRGGHFAIFGLLFILRTASDANTNRFPPTDDAGYTVLRASFKPTPWNRYVSQEEGAAVPNAVVS